ncbi:unnamed protein product [Aspergillus oryzae]|nr:unnamed protein product [Aspergillus oryzae]
MQNRIDRLESLVLSLMTNGSQAAGPAAAMAALSGNSSSIGSTQHTTDLDLDEDTSGGPEESDTEQVTKSFGIMKVDNNKSYYFSEAHWASVLNDDPSQTCIVWIGMLCAIMRLAMLSYHREGDEPPEFRGKTLDMAGTFRNLMAQCLTLADYTKPYPSLIESLIFHLHGDWIQTKDADVSVWVLVGVIARLAMRMGYHRDSKMFPNITPFQGEMRRRVWTIVRQYDLMFSFQVGLPSMIRSTDSDTEFPRNLYDDDFDENCKELPPSRPPNEPTPVSCLIAKGRLTYAFGRVIEHTSSIQSPSYDQVMEIDAELRRARDLIPEHLVVRPVEESQLEPPKIVMARCAVACIDSAMELLRFQSMLHSETVTRIRNKHDRLTALVSTDFLLAATIVSLDLYHGHQFQSGGRTSGDTYAWGRERREEMIAAIQRSKEIWDELRDDALEAWKASGALGVMLARLNLGYSDSNAAAPTFEPQDEKQSAAMTLGLLSSGMSPMNSAPPAFGDGTLKMGETPLPPQGGFGATADIPGAPSPLSAMFGQMPDMQLPLDWNAALDASNQWWPTMDQQQQQQPQPQPQSQNALGSAGLASVQNSAADKMRSLPSFSNVFYPDANVYDNNNSPPNNADLVSPGVRWNSQHVPSQPDLASKDAATTNENDEQLIQAAVGYMEGTSTPANETVDHISKKSEAQPQPTEEESKRAKRLRLLSKEPDPKETVFVGNLFYDVTADDLRKQMEKYGVVESVRAIDAMHMRVYEGRRVIVAFAQNNIDQHRNLRPISRTLYLGNLPFEMTDRDINELFRDIVNVIDVRVSVDRRTGMFRGFAHAEFINVESARAAFEILSRKAPYGRKLRLDYSQTNRRADRLEDNTE